MTLDADFLHTLNGGNDLIEGADYTVRLQVETTDGTLRSVQLGFTYSAAAAVPLEIALALSNDTGGSDDDGLTADPTLTGQLSDAGNINSLQARIGSGAYRDIADTLQTDGTFTLDLERLSELNGGTLPYSTYAVEVLAQTAQGAVDTFTIDFTYELQVVDTPFKQTFFEPIFLEAGSSTFQFGIDMAALAGTGDQLLAYLVDANDPTQPLLTTHLDGSPLLSVTEGYFTYNTRVVGVEGEIVSLDLSGLTPAQLQNAVLFFERYSPAAPTADPDTTTDPDSEPSSGTSTQPIYLSVDGGGSSGGSGGGGGGSRARINFDSSRSGSSSGGDTEALVLLTLVEGDGFTVTYEQPDDGDGYTLPTEIRFGESTLTFNYDGDDALGSSNDELIEVIAEAIGLQAPYGIEGYSEDVLRAGAMNPQSIEALEFSDLWTRIGEIVLKPNKNINSLTLAEQKKRLDFQEALLENAADTSEFQDGYENTDAAYAKNWRFLAQTSQLGLDLLTNENSLIDFLNLYPAESLDFNKFSYEAISQTLSDKHYTDPEETTLASFIDPNSELAWLAAITYTKVLSSESAEASKFTDGYSMAKTTLNRAKIVQSNIDSSEFGISLNGSAIKDIIQNYQAYENLAYNEFILGLEEGFDEYSRPYAESALEAVLLSLSTDILNNLSLLEEQYRVEDQGNRQVDNIRTNKEVLQYLRSHTRQGYTDGAFEDALGEQPYRGSELDPNTTLAGEYIDFGHFIASLAGQFGGIGTSGVAGSIVYDIGAGVSWSGDLGTAVISIVDGGNSVVEAMAQFAGNEDLAADIAAVVVGDMLSGSDRESQSVTRAVRAYDTDAGGFPEHVRTFVRNELSGQFGQPLILTNSETVRERIRSGIRNFLFKNPYRNEYNSTPEREDREVLAIDAVAEKFFQYLSSKGRFSL